jgi:hypothetical protein
MATNPTFSATLSIDRINAPLSKTESLIGVMIVNWGLLGLLKLALIRVIDVKSTCGF